MFRAMPNMTVIDPCDAHEIEQVVPAIAAHRGPVYMRLLRGQVPLVLDEYGYQFELGKAQADPRRRGRADHLLRPHDHARAGGRRSCWPTTASTPPCCTCRRSSRSTRQTILREAGKAGRLVVVAENHSVIGGLGEAVAAVLMRAGVHRASARSRCPTRSSPPARCRPCTIATASRPRP